MGRPSCSTDTSQGLAWLAFESLLLGHRRGDGHNAVLGDGLDIGVGTERVKSVSAEGTCRSR